MSSGNGSRTTKTKLPTAGLPFAAGPLDWRGRRVLVMGLGLFGGGVAATRWLAEQGARVTVTDLRPEARLRESVDALRGVDVEFRLGRHDEADFRRAEVLLVSPAVPPESPWLRKVAVLESEMNLFFKLCRSRRIIGVTGSNGKTTTCTLIHELLRRGGPAWLGGNIGRSLLDALPRIEPDHPVVLEISSFQLEHLGAIGLSPATAVVTNLTPNHLDRHGTMEGYAEAKRQIVAHQRPGDLKVLHASLDGAFDVGPARTIRYGPGGDVEADGPDAVRFLGRRIDLRGRRLPGAFNLENMMAALAAADRRGAEPEALVGFGGVEHRLELVAEAGGVRFYNDSIATNPESTIAALTALAGPILLILGGSDKKLPFDALGRAVAGTGVKFAALLGDTAPALDAVLGGVPRETVGDLESAVRACVARARPGDTVLLSPACASFGMFRNFAERGERFKSIVARLAA